MKSANNVLTLERAELMVRFVEFYSIFWADWYQYTDIEYDALAYLVEKSDKIILPNVKCLSEEKVALLRLYKGYLEIGFLIDLKS
jgi:hypothetical protein